MKREAGRGKREAGGSGSGEEGVTRSGVSAMRPLFVALVLFTPFPLLTRFPFFTPFLLFGSSPFPLPSSIIRSQRMRGIFVSMQSDEELLHVPIHATLTHLIGFDLHERVVSAFGPHRQLECAEWSGERPSARGGRGLRQPDRWKKLIRLDQHLGRCELSAVEVSHALRSLGGSFVEDVLHPVD